MLEKLAARMVAVCLLALNLISLVRRNRGESLSGEGWDEGHFMFAVCE